MDKPKGGMVIGIMAGKPKPPELDAPKSKAAVMPFGAKHEAMEPPKREVNEESAAAKLAYLKTALQDLVSMCGEDEEEESPEMDEEMEPE